MNIVLVTINNQSVNSRNITIKSVQFDRVILEKIGGVFWSAL